MSAGDIPIDHIAIFFSEMYSLFDFNFGIVSYYVAITCFELMLLLQPSKLPCSA